MAGLLSVTAFLLYNWKNLVGATHPNVSSWAVWAFITILNFTSYKKLTGDWVKSLLPTANAVMCILTALLALRTGSFRSLSGIDQFCLLMGIIASFCWWIFKSKDFAETLVQIILEVALVVGFIPTIVGVIDNPTSEPWLSWLLWTISFGTQFFVVKLTWRGKRIDFLYPINMSLFHGAVFALALL
jgi:predicted neutral ceramidase superfamily lipid hydrolase